MISLPDTARQIEEAKIFADRELRPCAGTFDATGILPRRLIQALAQRGYLAATFPVAYGGLGMDPITYGHFSEVIGKACCATRTLLTVHTSLVGESIVRWGNAAQKDKWLPQMASGEKIAAFALTEPDTGSDATSIQCTYKTCDNGYLLNGRKKWISFGDIADLFLVFAVEGDKKSAFVVERATPGVTTTPITGLLAGRATHIAEIDFLNVSVPAENILGKEGSGFPYIAYGALDHGRYSIAWAGVAIAQEALEAMVSYARKRVQFGKKIAEFQLIQGIIADATTQVRAARALCLSAGLKRQEKTQDAEIETNIAKYFSSKVAMKVATDAVQVFGGNGCCDKYPVERLFREAKVMEIIEGTSQIQQGLISEYALREYFK